MVISVMLAHTKLSTAEPVTATVLIGDCGAFRASQISPVQPGVAVWWRTVVVPTMRQAYSLGNTTALVVECPTTSTSPAGCRSLS
jgi:hypothetical protein